ncbi:MAG: bifunctional phosphopantothenoylcysteine decarboxylase/phosphopantothenate--cysteine ligase CoaBC, partial [Proteobacteria bacterium]
MLKWEGPMNKPSKILFQLSGSIACFKACALLSKLSQAGYEIEVVASRSALQFVGEATLEGLTGKRVHTDTFEAGRAMDHIHLMRWADVIVLCPASANTLNKFASGFGDDLLSTMFLAHDFRKPYLIAPAMNQFMWSHPATKASVEKLQSWGLEILGTGKGNLACGEVGEGRMLEPEQIQMAIELALGLALALPQAQKTSGRHILITSGGTEEPIDGVRSITNTSTGRTGADLAHWF